MANDTASVPSRLAAVPPLTAATLLLALLGLPALAVLDRTVGLGIGPAGRLGVEWLLAAAVVGLAVGVQGRSLPTVGFRRPGWADLGYLLLTAAAALVVFAATDPLVAALGLPVSDDAGTMSAGVGLGLALAGAVTTGVVEEVLFRGYPIELLLDATDSPPVAGGVTWGVFTLAHAAVWPVGNLLQVAAVAALFTVVYLRRRTLVPVVGAHVLVWGFAVLGQFYG
jgi:membrane protease YdiL (CAAX protease family)